MNGIFARKGTRFALFTILFVVGLLLIFMPERIRYIVGGDIDLWTGMVGAGFLTGAVIGLGVITGAEPGAAFVQGFLIASIAAEIVIILNWTPGWIVPFLAALLITFLSAKAKYAVAKSKQSHPGDGGGDSRDIFDEE